MYSHVTVGVQDFERALMFYRSLLPALGLVERFCEPARPWAAWQPAQHARPLFIIGAPFDGALHEPGNGQMIALAADTRSQVDAVYKAALASGGRSEGAPGLRPHYHDNYYGAYFRDTEGNKLCVVCHHPKSLPGA